MGGRRERGRAVCASWKDTVVSREEDTVVSTMSAAEGNKYDGVAMACVYGVAPGGFGVVGGVRHACGV